MGKKRGKYKIFIHTDMQLLGEKKKRKLARESMCFRCNQKVIIKRCQGDHRYGKFVSFFHVEDYPKSGSVRHQLTQGSRATMTQNPQRS